MTEMISSKPASADPMSKFNMLDTKRAVEALGSSDLFQIVAEEYYKSGQKTFDSIKESYDAEDWENYTIRVHALKSSSRQIGAMELGSMAEKLEKAGNEKDIEYIRANTEDTLSVFGELLDKLSDIFD